MKPRSYHKWNDLNKISVCLVRHRWANQSLDTKSENRQVSSMPKAKLAWPFQERRISMQGSCRTRYDLQVWRHLAAVHTKTALSSSVTYSGLWRLSRTFKFSHLTNLVPPNHNAQQQALSRREVPPAWPRAPLLEGCTSPIALYHGHNKRSSI